MLALLYLFPLTGRFDRLRPTTAGSITRLHLCSTLLSDECDFTLALRYDFTSIRCQRDFHPPNRRT